MCVPQLIMGSKKIRRLHLIRKIVPVKETPWNLYIYIRKQVSNRLRFDLEECMIV